MDGETTMNGNGKAQTKMPDVAASVSDLTHDVIELSELQAKLLILDVKQTSQNARTCLILGAAGACLLLGTVPVALIFLGELLDGLGMSRVAGFGVATLVGIALVATLFGLAWWHVKSGMVSLQRSRDELNRNIAWIKSTLRSRGQTHGDERPIIT
jgi:hypothetical protein